MCWSNIELRMSLTDFEARLVRAIIHHHVRRVHRNETQANQTIEPTLSHYCSRWHLPPLLRLSAM